MAWKEITVFLSSTFNDMQSERDYIKRKVISRLNQSLEQYQVSIRLLDLRWGIDTHLENEIASEDKVLHVCLDLIRNNRPYFIGLLGHRYGWVPSLLKQEDVRSIFQHQDNISIQGTESRSVTEMEILLGALGQEEYLDHSFFFLRDEETYFGMDDEIRGLYDDRFSHEQEKRALYPRLQSLKEKIINTCKQASPQERVFTYKGRWDGNTITELDDFGDVLYKQLLDDILSRIEKDLTTSNEDAEKMLQDTFCKTKQNGFSGREELINQVIRHIEHYTKTHPNYIEEPKNMPVNGIVLYGPAGCGKSSIYSELVKRLANDNRFILKNASCGLSNKSSSVRNILSYWEQCSEDIEPSLESDKKKVFLLDSVESVSDINKLADIFTSYSWTIYPYVLTCTEEYLDTLKQEIAYYQTLSHKKGKCEFIRIEKPKDKEILDTIEHVLTDNHKQLSSSCKEKLVSRLAKIEPDTSLFWLRLALSVLMELGEKDFRAIHSLPGGNDSQKIEHYLYQTIESFPDTLSGMLKYYIDMTNEYFDNNIVEAFLYYMSRARFGLTAQNIEDLLGKNWNSLEFESLLYWMKEFIRKDRFTGKMTLGHRLFKIVIRNADWLEKDFQTLFKTMHEKGTIDDNEYLYMCMESGDIDTFHDYMVSNNGYMHPAVQSAVPAFLRDDEDRCFSFLEDYFSYYRTDSRSDDLAYCVALGRSETSPEAKRLMKKVKIYLLKQFSPDDLISGDLDVLQAFFKSINSYRVESPIPLHTVLKVYYDNKRLYGKSICTSWLPYYFYNYWGQQIALNEHIDVYLEFEKECRWYCDNVDDYTWKLDLFENTWLNGCIIDRRSYCLLLEEKLRILQVVQEDYLAILSTDLEADDFWFSKFLEDGTKLVEYYRELHNYGFSDNKLPFIPTPLSNYLETKTDSLSLVAK